MLLHPWALSIGAGALAAPFVIHWLTRPRPTRVPLSTVKFVREIIQQRKSYNRLRDWLILLCRVAAIALLALAIGRPILGDRGAAASAAQSNTKRVRVVLLDLSQSMAATSESVQVFERARSMAARHLDPPLGTEANLILAAATAQPVFDRPSTNAAALVDEVGRAKPLPQRIRVQEAINVAAEMLTKSGDKSTRRELVVISDFQRSNWSGMDLSPLPAETEIRLESVAPEVPPDNVGIVGVRSQGRVESGRPFRLEVEVHSSSAASRPVAVDVKLGDRQLNLKGTATGSGRSVLVSEVEMPGEGWLSGEARLNGIEDGLKEDDRRLFALHVHPRPVYALLTRQAAYVRTASSYFVERAISRMGEGSASEPLERIVRVDPTKTDRGTLQSADLLLLDHPGRLPEETLQLLAALMHRGRGLLYIASEPADAVNIKQLATIAGSGLQLPVEFAPPQVGAPRKNLFLIEIQRRRVPFSVFGEETDAVFSSVRFDGGLASRPIEGSLADDVLARFNDQSAALVVTSCGAGSLAILNAELKSSNLPASAGFVPLLGELVGHLLGRDRSQDAIHSGEALAVYLPPSALPLAGLRIESEAKGAVEGDSLGELREETAGVLWQSPEAGAPGHYSVKRGGETVFALATAIAEEESDLATLPADVLTSRLAGGRDVQFHSGPQDEQPRDTLWTWLAVACVGCLFLELVGLLVFRS